MFMPIAMDPERTTKACKHLLRSADFRYSKYRQNCHQMYGARNRNGEVDHIIDLETVATWFSRAFSKLSLEICLEVNSRIHKLQ